MAKKPPLTSSKKVKFNTTMHTASAAAAGIGAGLAKLPMSDHVPLIAIQITMSISLENIFEIELSDGAARGFDGYLSKPIDAEMLTKTMNEVLHGKD